MIGRYMRVLSGMAMMMAIAGPRMAAGEETVREAHNDCRDTARPPAAILMQGQATSDLSRHAMCVAMHARLAGVERDDALRELPGMFDDAMRKAGAPAELFEVIGGLTRWTVEEVYKADMSEVLRIHEKCSGR